MREPKTPADLVYLLGEVGAYGVAFHDIDPIPIAVTPANADAIKREFRQALPKTNLVAPMATTDLFGDPIFMEGAFASNAPKVRAHALQKNMRAIDLGVEFGQRTALDFGGWLRKSPRHPAGQPARPGTGAANLGGKYP